MNVKKSLAVLFFGVSALGYAQEEIRREESDIQYGPELMSSQEPSPMNHTQIEVKNDRKDESTPIFQVDALKNVDINLLLRSSFEAPHTEYALDGTTATANAFKMNEARLEFRGKLVDNLEFRVRTRLHRVGAEASLDRSSSALDHASLSYKFGENRKWEVLFGKQNNMIGSWEFDKNPTFEYQYSDVVGNYNNLFALGARVGYSPSSNHTFTIQAINAHNNQFNNQVGAAYIGDNTAAKTPLLAQFIWQGKFFNKVWNTWYSVGGSQYAKDKTNLQVFVGNKIAKGNFEGYLDLGYSKFEFDHFNIANRTGNAYTAFYKNANPLVTQSNVIAEDIDVKSAVLRLDYKFLEKWNVTAKGFYETVSAKDDALGDNFRRNLGYLIGLEFLPIAKQNFRFFAYYYGNDIKYNNNVYNLGVKSVHSNIFAVGALYVINVL